MDSGCIVEYQQRDHKDAARALTLVVSPTPQSFKEKRENLMYLAEPTLPDGLYRGECSSRKTALNLHLGTHRVMKNHEHNYRQLLDNKRSVPGRPHTVVKTKNIFTDRLDGW